MICADKLRWSRSSLGWQIQHTKFVMQPRELPTIFVAGTRQGRTIQTRRFEYPPRRKVTIAECRAASALEARCNPIHAENAAHFVAGNRYSWYDETDGRVFIDAVWVPEFCEVPSALRSYISKGGCHSSPGDPGTWWLNVGHPATKNVADVCAPLVSGQLDLFGARA